jgi:hypothetical protein
VTATALELPSVMVSVEAPPTPTVDGENAFASVGWLRTARLAEAPLAVPAFAVVTLPVALL